MFTCTVYVGFFFLLENFEYYAFKNRETQNKRQNQSNILLKSVFCSFVSMKADENENTVQLLHPIEM